MIFPLIAAMKAKFYNYPITDFLCMPMIYKLLRELT